MISVFILIETVIGTSSAVLGGLRALQEVRSAERVTGPYDVIAQVEAVDLEALGGLLENRIHSLPGVQRSVTCVVVP